MVAESIALEFTIDCPPDHAFDVWTCRTTMWWPSEHTMSRDPSAVVTFEPGAGGRIFERTADGTELDWGRVLAWEPPGRLRYTWHIATERENATEVEITFEADGGGTKVRVHHDGFGRLGAFGDEWRRANRLGWAGTIPVYRRACAASG